MSTSNDIWSARELPVASTAPVDHIFHGLVGRRVWISGRHPRKEGRGSGILLSAHPAFQMGLVNRGFEISVRISKVEFEARVRAVLCPNEFNEPKLNSLRKVNVLDFVVVVVVVLGERFHRNGGSLLFKSARFSLVRRQKLKNPQNTLSIFGHQESNGQKRHQNETRSCSPHHRFRPMSTSHTPSSGPRLSAHVGEMEAWESFFLCAFFFHIRHFCLVCDF